VPVLRTTLAMSVTPSRTLPSPAPSDPGTSRVDPGRGASSHVGRARSGGLSTGVLFALDPHP